MGTVKALAKGQIVIPSEIRKKYRIKPGTEMQILEYGSVIYVKWGTLVRRVPRRENDP